MVADVTTNDSTTNDDFIEYEYTEDGLEESLLRLQLRFVCSQVIVLNHQE